MAGTATRVDVWIMLEYRRAWQAKAIETNTFDALTQRWLAQTVTDFANRGLIARPQFIRRPQRSDGIHLFVAHNGQLNGTQVADEKSLQQLDLVDSPLPEAHGPQYFVCTNAKRDLCCAKFGRPTYAAIHRALPDRVWQTTHVGGHRYAPNILELPSANLYGRVFANDVPEFLAITERKETAWRFLRGNCALTQVAQTAQQVLAEQYDSLSLLQETEDSATFATSDGVRRVSVKPDENGLDLMPSCGKETKRVYPLRGTIEKS